MSKERYHRLNLIRTILEKGEVNPQTELIKRFEKKESMPPKQQFPGISKSLATPGHRLVMVHTV